MGDVPMVDRFMIRSHHFCAILPATDKIIGMHSAEVLALLKGVVQAAGLTTVGEASAMFEPQGVSVVLILEESHVALHVWTESQKVTVDVHVCDYSQDNYAKAHYLTQLLEQQVNGGYDRTHWTYFLATG
jgi:S-adenosylmethionine decarboxylase